MGLFDLVDVGLCQWWMSGGGVGLCRWWVWDVGLCRLDGCGFVPISLVVFFVFFFFFEVALGGCGFVPVVAVSVCAGGGRW